MVEAYSKRSDKVEAAREQYEFNKRLTDYKTSLETPSKSTTYFSPNPESSATRPATSWSQPRPRFVVTYPNSVRNFKRNSRSSAVYN
jgi:hypothetical protein